MSALTADGVLLRTATAAPFQAVENALSPAARISPKATGLNFP
jgi:hypothetical protein